MKLLHVDLIYKGIVLDTIKQNRDIKSNFFVGSDANLLWQILNKSFPKKFKLIQKVGSNYQFNLRRGMNINVKQGEKVLDSSELKRMNLVKGNSIIAKPGFEGAVDLLTDYKIRYYFKEPYKAVLNSEQKRIISESAHYDFITKSGVFGIIFFLTFLFGISAILGNLQERIRKDNEEAAAKAIEITNKKVQATFEDIAKEKNIPIDDVKTEQTEIQSYVASEGKITEENLDDAIAQKKAIERERAAKVEKAKAKAVAASKEATKAGTGGTSKAAAVNVNVAGGKGLQGEQGPKTVSTANVNYQPGATTGKIGRSSVSLGSIPESERTTVMDALASSGAKLPDGIEITTDLSEALASITSSVGEGVGISVLAEAKDEEIINDETVAMGLGDAQRMVQLFYVQKLDKIWSRFKNHYRGSGSLSISFQIKNEKVIYVEVTGAQYDDKFKKRFENEVKKWKFPNVQESDVLVIPRAYVRT